MTKNLFKAVKNYASLIQKYLIQNSGRVIVHSFVANAASSIVGQKFTSQILHECNLMLQQYCSKTGRLSVVDISSIVSQGLEIFDPRIWYIGRIPFSHGLTLKLAGFWSSIVLAHLEKTTRLIILDLDNTLWGGVVGEDGIESIKIRGDYPGNCFTDFQIILKQLSRNGIALALCSKNDEDVALKVFENLATMVLSKEDIVAFRINWCPKYQNIQEITKELSLGLDSVLFIDDNPVEREAIRKNLPEVKVLELPQDPALYGKSLMECPWVEILSVSTEDSNRVASYKTKVKIDEGLKGTEDITSFLADLKIKVFIQELSTDNEARAGQLCVKTNQFNTTTKRYSATDLRKIKAERHEVFVIGMEDALTARENIGVLILIRNSEDINSITIDLFLLSCRVLGRGIDTAVIEWCVFKARSLGCGSVRGELIESERNTVVRDLFEKHKFQKIGSDNVWVREEMSANLPSFLTIEDYTDD